MKITIEANGYKVFEVSLPMLMNMLSERGEPTLFAVGTRVKTTVAMGFELISEEVTVMPPEDNDHE
jgi:hypothetical protein